LIQISFEPNRAVFCGSRKSPAQPVLQGRVAFSGMGQTALEKEFPDLFEKFLMQAHNVCDNTKSALEPLCLPVLPVSARSAFLTITAQGLGSKA
jgi:hypothetical protein